MIALVKNYKLGVCRGHRPGPVRTLDFVVETRDDRRVDRVYIHFFEKPQAYPGFFNQANNTVAFFLPMSDFDDVCALLEGPDDVFVSWVDDSEHNLVWAEITTSEHALEPAATLAGNRSKDSD